LYERGRGEDNLFKQEWNIWNTVQFLLLLLICLKKTVTINIFFWLKHFFFLAIMRSNFKANFHLVSVLILHLSNGDSKNLWIQQFTEMFIITTAINWC
jgi:hypothetical protein